MSTPSPTCPNCGAPLDVAPGDSAIKCSHCRTDLRISPSGQATPFFGAQPEWSAGPPGVNMAAVEGLVRAGRKIEAIKHVREQTNWGLKESKDFVDEIEARQRQVRRPPPSAPGSPDWARIRQELERGRKIEAIKLYRAQTGVGLKEAKDAVERFERDQAGPGAQEPQPGSGAARGRVKVGGCSCLQTLVSIAFFILLFTAGCGFYVQTTDEYACGMQAVTQNREVIQRLGQPVEPLPLALVVSYESSSDFGGGVNVAFSLFTYLTGSLGGSWAYVQVSHQENFPHLLRANLYHEGDQLRIITSVPERDCLR